MVKKAPLPKVVEDAKFYTVYRPYPMNVNCEIPEDVNRLCVWIATVMGKPDPLFAIHHKPTARGMLIIEVAKEYPPKPLLGEHRWSQILKVPSLEEKGCKSQIFYSLYTKAHELRDDGWKKIDLKDEHFLDFMPGPANRTFRHPYPASHWCPVPNEDVTNKRLCRPLPVTVVPPPPPAPTVRVVPGSIQHANSQSGSATTNTNANPPGAGGGNSKNKRRRKKNGQTVTNGASAPVNPPFVSPASTTYPPPQPIIHDAFIDDDDDSPAAAAAPLAEDMYGFILGEDSGNMEDIIAPYEQVDNGHVIGSDQQTEAEWRQALDEPFVASGPWNGNQFTLHVTCSEHPKKDKQGCVDAKCVTFLREYKYAERKDQLKANFRCPEHPARTCKKGICTAYKSAYRKAEQELKEEEKRERQADKRKVARTGGGKAKSQSSSSGRSTPLTSNHGDSRPTSAQQNGRSSNADAGNEDDEWNEVPGKGRGGRNGRGGRMAAAAQAADDVDPWA